MKLFESYLKGKRGETQIGGCALEVTWIFKDHSHRQKKSAVWLLLRNSLSGIIILPASPSPCWALIGSWKKDFLTYKYNEALLKGEII